MNFKESSKYKILKRLSQGAFGTIYSAIDTTTGK
jgi:serine/threonine protein kinase